MKEFKSLILFYISRWYFILVVTILWNMFMVPALRFREINIFISWGIMTLSELIFFQRSIPLIKDFSFIVKSSCSVFKEILSDTQNEEFEKTLKRKENRDEDEEIKRKTLINFILSTKAIVLGLFFKMAASFFY